MANRHGPSFSGKPGGCCCWAVEVDGSTCLVRLTRKARNVTTQIADDEVSRCPACGDPIDYCPGHGRNADPVGWGTLVAHDLGAHDRCHPSGCTEAEWRRRR